jgi:chemotaxis protein histidine kinase CheA
MSKITKLNEIEKIIKDPFFYYADEKNKPALMKKYGQANNTVTKLKVIEEYIIGLKEEEEEDEDFENLDNLITAEQSKQKIAEEAAKKKEEEAAAAKKKEEEAAAAKKKEEEAAAAKKKEEEAEEQERKEAAKKEAAKKEAAREAAEEEQERRAAEIAKRMEDDKKASEKAAAEKKQKDEKLLAEANKIALGFESEFDIFVSKITEAKNKESVEQSLSKAEKYFNETNTKLKQIFRDISDKSKSKTIEKIQSGLESAYEAFGFKTLATDRIAELKIEEEEKKLWSTDGFNENFQRIWGTDFKQEFEKDRWKALDPEKRKSLINKIKEFVVFFNTCDNNLEIIIKKIEIAETKKNSKLIATLNFFKSLKFVFGSAVPTLESGHGTFASTRDAFSIQNNFLSKLLYFFESIIGINNTQITFHLSSITNDFSIIVNEFVLWLGSILTGLKKYDKFEEIKDEITKLNINTPGGQQNLRKFLHTIFPAADFKQGKFFMENENFPKIETIPPLSDQKAFKNKFLTASFQKPRNEMFTEYNNNTSTIGGKTKKLKRKQIFSKTHKNIYPHNNGTANRFYRGQHRSRKNHHIHQITVRKY